MKKLGYLRIPPVVPAVPAQSEEREEGHGEAQDSPGNHVGRVVLVVRHPRDGHRHRVHHQQHLRSLSFNQIVKGQNILQEVEIFVYKPSNQNIQPSYFF